jgi:hypothetical protein
VMTHRWSPGRPVVVGVARRATASFCDEPIVIRRDAYASVVLCEKAIVSPQHRIISFVRTSLVRERSRKGPFFWELGALRRGPALVASP